MRTRISSTCSAAARASRAGSRLGLFHASGSMLFEIDAKRWCGELLSYAGVAESSLYHAVQAGPCWGVRGGSRPRARLR